MELMLQDKVGKKYFFFFDLQMPIEQTSFQTHHQGTQGFYTFYSYYMITFLIYFSNIDSLDCNLSKANFCPAIIP